ncbi:ABC transporter G family member 11-like isoform X1 [Papaver somniferum]|uniref:ABC transporter G family member 11-like isoform X1 n=1 Tax=Papaver somniferum TaxID=3469 RepID=UPI000E6F8776|nr:ABC transporter G family member 11-like isoform X1 [Papaver somniferum]
MASSSPSSNLRWTPTASPISSPVPPPLLSKEKSSFACHDQIEDEPFMSPAHQQQQQQQLDQYVDEPVENDIVVNSFRVSGHQSSKKKKSEEKKNSFVIEMEQKSKGSVVLTWEDLCVRVPSSSTKGKDKAILEGLNGYAQPGEVLAIMGPSGSGKSTLIDALAGRLSSNTSQSGMIKVNGRKQRLSFGTSAYVTQDNTLTTTLTVKEAVHYSALLQLPDSMTTSEKKERADTTIKEMGLHEARNTRIGGWNIVGISGGQKRRVSICIEILTRPELLFLDEPTSGLDSAASYHVMNRIVKLSRQYNLTVIASVHQPSSEVFDLFHNLCLLSSGRTIYFGPTYAANEFFALNGFPCPTMRNPSDHYLRTINKDFDQDIEQGYGGKATTTEEAINTLVESYKSSPIFQQVKTQVSTLCKRARGSVLMFVVSFLTFMAIGGFPSFVEDMKIFGRERLNGHYGVAAFVVGNTLSSIPYLLMISVIPGALAYYLVGLHKGYEHFLFFVLLLFVCMVLVESLMMIVASVVPDFLMGIITGAGIQGVMMLNAGFFRVPNDLPDPFWRYPMYYIAFHRYAVEGFYKNEFQGLQFPNNQIGGSLTISGEEVLKNIWQIPTCYSKWLDLVVLFGMVVLYRLIFFSIIKLSEKMKSPSCLKS